MAIISTDDKHYKNIAKEIRSASGENTSYTPAQMPSGIQKVYETGRSDGMTTGYGEGYVDGWEEGERNYRRFFWEHYQDEGARKNYNFAFAGPGWTEELFWPQHDITVESGFEMFAYCGFAGSLKERLAQCRVALQFSGNQTLMNLFGFADKITELGVIDFSAVSPSSINTHIFSQCSSLHTIEKLILPVGQPVWTGWFGGCSALENIRIEGSIVSSGMDFSACSKLTRESMLSVLHALTDASKASGTWKITFGGTNLAKLTDSDKAIATNKGWTLA